MVVAGEPLDESEANTTVLTSSLRTPGPQPGAPGGFAPVQPGGYTPGGFTPVQPGVSAVGGEQLDESEANTTVLTSPVQTSAPQPGGYTPGGFMPVQPGINGNGMQPGINAEDFSLQQGENKKDKKKHKKEKQNKQNKKNTEKNENLENENIENESAKVKSSSGANIGGRIYLVVSLVLIVGLAGAGAYFYMSHTSKIDDLNAEVASLTDANQEFEADKAKKDTLIADYEAQISQLNGSLKDDEATIASLQEDISDYSNSSEYYANYNGLIGFADANTGTSSSTFFASDTVLHMTTEDMTVYVYVPETTDLNYVIENTDVANCEWIGWANDNVAILKVTPGAVIGSTKITLTKASAQTEEGSDDENAENADETTEEASAEETAAEPEETVEIFVYNN
jgi:hypothetical protein